MSTGQFVMCVLGDFRQISCKGSWLVDPVSLICIHSHGGSHSKSSQQWTVRSTVLVFPASPLKMGSSTSPTYPSMVMHLRDVLLRQSSKLPVASSPTYVHGEMKRHCIICESGSVPKAHDEACSSKVYMSNFPSCTHQRYSS